MADATSMFDPLSDAEATTETKASHRGAGGDWTPILPPSAAAPDDFEHPKHGTPSIVWEYHNKSGELEGYQCRFDFVDDDGNPDKTFRQYRYGTLNGRTGWHWRGWGDKRPLYRLPDILARPDAQVRIFEGEKAADAAQVLFPDCVTTTPMNGAKSPGKTDYKPLAGRTVVAWADNDEPGIEFAWEIERLALEAGAETVDVFQVPVYFPSGWDWADPMPEGWTTEKLLELPPASRPPMGETGGKNSRAGDEAARRRNWPFKPKEDGVYKLVENKDQETEWRWFCSSLEVAAVTRDHNGEAWGRLLIVTDRDGAKHEWAMPMKMLAADGAPYREHLLSLGLEIAPGRFAKDALHEYIATAQPEERARCVPRTGWHGCTYVLPDITYGQTEGERVLLQTASMEHAFRLAGSLEGWQENLGQYCVGNSRLVLAVSAAFAAPLLIIASEDSGGINFVGPSRTGKTTALRVAGSVWGGGGITGYLRTWRATSNGLESIAQSHCDALLALDEMGQVDPREAGEVAYMLANGAGKSRARRDGSARPPAEWRVLFLSTGEMGLADKMIEGGKRPRAGQEVRLVDVPSDAGAGLGIFEELHGFASSEVFARHLGTRAMKFYGAPIRIFLEKVTAVEFTAIGDALKMARDDFMAAYVPEDAGGQVLSVAGRFALIAAAGTLATAFDVTSWPEDEAANGAGKCFSAWLEGRGGTGAAEIRAGIAQIRRFLEAHGTSKFEPMGTEPAGGVGEPFEVRIINRAGFRKKDDEGRWEYFVLPLAWREELCGGFNAGMLTKELVSREMLIPDRGDGKPQSRHKLPGMGTKRCYHLSAAILGADDV